ncbi:MAG: hypothetical protein LBQ55_01660, partial [Treponema sp.]|nr:hypothetical protein [Treponema sp.]
MASNSLKPAFQLGIAFPDIFGAGKEFVSVVIYQYTINYGNLQHISGVSPAPGRTDHFAGKGIKKVPVNRGGSGTGKEYLFLLFADSYNIFGNKRRSGVQIFGYFNIFSVKSGKKPLLLRVDEWYYQAGKEGTGPGHAVKGGKGRQ